MRKYFLHGNTEASSAHAAFEERELNLVIGTSGTSTVGHGPEVDSLSHMFTSRLGEPDVADHADGNWTLSVSINASTGADMEYGPVAVTGGSTGHIAVVNAGSDRETFTLSGGAQTGTGTKTWGPSTWNPGAGAAADLLEVLIAGYNSHMHNTEDLVIDHGHADSWFETTIDDGGVIPIVYHRRKQAGLM